MDNETKKILKPLMESLVNLTVKQGMILSLLADKLPDMEGETRTKLLDSAQATQRHAETIRQQLSSF